MDKVSKIAISVAVKIRQGTQEMCLLELENALKAGMGDYFVEIMPASCGGIFADLDFGVGPTCVCHLIFLGNADRAIFERQSITHDILEKLPLKSCGIAAISHTPYYYSEYKEEGINTF